MPTRFTTHLKNHTHAAEGLLFAERPEHTARYNTRPLINIDVKILCYVHDSMEDAPGCFTLTDAYSEYRRTLNI